MKIPKRTQELLDEVGNYHLARGKRHIRIFVNGMFCGILPNVTRGDGNSVGRGELNTLAQIRRAARGALA